MTLPPVGLVQACDDPALFAFDLWSRQRELLTAVERGPRIHVFCVGRRSGKTTLAALVCLWDALLRPELDSLVRPGEMRFAVGVATNLQQARLLISAARSVVETSPLLAEMVEASTDDEIRFRLPSGAKTAVRAFPCSSRGGRGWPISTLVMDECAHFLSETDGFQTAQRVWEALVPSTSQFGPHARIIAASTPYGSDSLFADLYAKADTGEMAEAEAHHATTAQVNPTIEPDFLEQERLRDPDSYEAEYEAKFLGSGNAFLDFSLFDIGPPGELPPEVGTGWLGGLDPSFSSDPAGCAVVGRDPADPRQLLVGAVRAWRPRRKKADSFEEQATVQEEVLSQIIDFLDPFGVSQVWTDQYAARGVIDRLGRDGIFARQLAMGAATKTAIYTELRSRLYDGSLILPDHPDLLAELRRLRTRYAAGSSSVVIPRTGGSHGDMAQALAMATYAMRGGGGANGRLPRGDGRGGKLSSGEVGGRPGLPVSLTEEQHDALTGADRAARGGGGKWSGDNR